MVYVFRAHVLNVYVHLVHLLIVDLPTIYICIVRMLILCVTYVLVVYLLTLQCILTTYVFNVSILDVCTQLAYILLVYPILCTFLLGVPTYYKICILIVCTLLSTNSSYT